MRRAAPALLADVDLLVMPTTVVPAPTLAGLLAKPDELRPREMVLTRHRCRSPRPDRPRRSTNPTS
jgi:hypothetical protein